MDYRSQVKLALQRADSIRVAKAPPQEGQEWLDPSESGSAQLAQQGEGGNATRQIPKSHKFDPKSLKPMAKMLWAMSVSMGHALQAYRLFNRVKSSTVSPDGMLGGRGYVMKVTELRQKLYEAVEALSAVSDTVHDEINAPHWKPKIGELTKEDFESIERLIGESENMLDNPEEEVDEEEEEVEKKGKPSSSWIKKMKGDKSDKEPASDFPTGGDSEATPKGKKPSSDESQGSRPKMASVYDRSVRNVVRQVMGNSSVSPDTLPGPRVQHLDRADTDQDGAMGAVNPDEPVPPKDEWAEEKGVSGEPMSQNHGDHPAYQWDGGRSATPQAPVAESAMPGANSDPTPTEGYDFGIGRGNGNDAHGQGAGGQSQTYSPEMGDKGVYGPRAELPDDPGGKTHDRENGDSNPQVEQSLNTVFKTAREQLRKIQGIFMGPDQPSPQSGLPRESPEVARADYYTGPKDNDQDSIKGPTENPVMAQGTAESELPNSSPPSPPRPLESRPSHFNEFMFADAQLPGDDSAVNETFDKDLMDTGYRYERVDEPYTKWDDNTPNMRPDWNSQRDDQGPYAKPGN